MKDQVISFETAKLAKEKGLEDGLVCPGYYCIGYGNHFQPDYKIIKEDYGRNSVKGQFHLALSPTQSLLQRWLRDEHLVFINVERESIGSDEWVFGYCIEYLPKEYFDVKRRSIHFSGWIKSYKEGIGSYVGGWDTYEEALENGLKEALKLI